MYASLEDAWQDPLLVPSDRGFVLHPRHRPEFMAPSATEVRSGLTVPSYDPDDAAEGAPPVPRTRPLPPTRQPRPYTPPSRGLWEEGFDGGAPSRSSSWMSPRSPHRDDEILRELRRLREELDWVRQERVDLQRRLDFICLLLFGLSILFASDMIRRWTPAASK